jgi:hypothetical protein
MIRFPTTPEEVEKFELVLAAQEQERVTSLHSDLDEEHDRIVRECEAVRKDLPGDLILRRST